MASLPAHPRPRARSASRPRDEDRQRSDLDSGYATSTERRGQAPSRSLTNSRATKSSLPSGPRHSQLRQQRSLASLPASTPHMSSRRQTYETTVPPIPSRNSNQSNASVSSLSSRRPPSLTSSATPPSTSSSNSSFLERMKPSNAGGYSSGSRTSLDTNSDVTSPQNSQPKGRPWGNSKENADLDGVTEVEAANPEGYTGYGYAIWDRITTAASSLTVNVNLSWASNIVTQSGEETPPGSESRLTRAMKAYHLEKAKTKSDLPAWLFNESERGMAMSSKGEERDEWGRPVENNGRSRERELYADEGGGNSNEGRRRGLRDIYDAAAASDVRDGGRDPGRTRSTRREDDSSGRYDREDVSRSASRATNRLKAIRDAKRLAMGVGRESDFGVEAQSQERVPSRAKDTGGRESQDSRSRSRAGGTDRRERGGVGRSQPDYDGSRSVAAPSRATLPQGPASRRGGGLPSGPSRGNGGAGYTDLGAGRREQPMGGGLPGRIRT